ncbi:sigma-70 family RNA polymerase sigma factor [Streptomyces sp. NPDC049954]|uniref:sigma-70 family RNA polymerase sigma factor n=1 Tax=Streptomyces sp. NPDC049954 TaxID=3155779 RepID=UPI00342DFAF8
MSDSRFPDGRLVAAALGGDARAEEELLTGCLHLVYQLVGRAADRDLDVDDVVQETMLRIVRGLPEVREQSRFRSWVVTIALRSLTEARRAAGTRRLRAAETSEEALGAPEPDLAALVSLRDALTREQRQFAEAVQWLDPGYRELLSLWWLEVTGRLDREELARATGLSGPHLAVRLQRMRGQLDVCRRLVRALAVAPRCPELARCVDGGEPVAGPLVRKRLARHVRDCRTCGGSGRRLVAPEQLLAGFPLLVPPASARHWLRHGLSATRHSLPHSAASHAPSPGPGRHSAHSAPRRAPHGGRPGRARWTVTAGAAGAAAVLAGGLWTAANGTGTDEVEATAARARTTAPAPATVPPSPKTHGPQLDSSTARPEDPPRKASASASPRHRAVSPRVQAPAVPPFSTKVPKVPAASGGDLGTVRQNPAVGARDNGQSTLYEGRSLWIFDDTTLRDPWGFLSNSGAATADLDASDGIDLRSTSPFTTSAQGRPVELLPRTAAERAFEKQHGEDGGCTAEQDQYCGARFGFWPGPVISDPARHRVLVMYGKLCRGGKDGTPCSGELGKGLGTGIAALDMRTHRVTRLEAAHGPGVRGVEGADPTMFFPDGQGFSAAALVVGETVYVYGDCSYHGCAVARVPLASVEDRSAWRFCTGDGWSPDPGAARPVVGAGSAGQSVFYDRALSAYVNVYLPYGSDEVRYQVGGSPYGPWSDPRTAGHTKGGKRSDYALFAHPEYARDGGLTQYLTYFHPDDGSQRLMRVRFSKP